MQLKSRLNAILTILLSYVPRRLPEFADQYAAWEAQICQVGNFPLNDSFRHAIATQVLHLPPHIHYKSQQYFINNLRRSMANQTAFGVIQDTKGPKHEQEVQGA